MIAASVKSDVRKEALRRRSQLTETQRHSFAATARENLANLIEDLSVSSLALYAAIRGEVDVFPMVSLCLAEDITLFLPRVRGAGLPLDFIAFGGLDELVKGRFGILEPQGSEVAALTSVEAIVVPGVAFTRCGVRLGYGGGYFDRTLADYEGYKLGFGFDLQVWAELPVDEGDVGMDAVVTEGGIERCVGGKLWVGGT
mgnify:CR=1 FL=1